MEEEEDHLNKVKSGFWTMLLTMMMNRILFLKFIDSTDTNSVKNQKILMLLKDSLCTEAVTLEPKSLK